MRQKRTLVSVNYNKINFRFLFLPKRIDNTIKSYLKDVLIRKYWRS